MGKKLFGKIVAIFVMIISSVAVFGACKKDPYKNMRLTLEVRQGETVLDDVEITYTTDEDKLAQNRFDVIATVSGVGKKVNKDVQFVIGNNSVIAQVGEPVVTGNVTTATFVALENGGETRIDVLTLEGEQKEHVDVSVVIPVENIEFKMTSLPIERGVKTDITANFDGISTHIYDRLTFTPEKTTQRNVLLSAYIGDVEATADQIEIDGKFITVKDEATTSFTLKAVSAYDDQLVTEVVCNVVEPIDLDKITLIADNEPIDDVVVEGDNEVYVVNLANTSSSDVDAIRKTITAGVVDGEYNGKAFSDLFQLKYVKSDKALPFKVVAASDGAYVLEQGVNKDTGTIDFAIYHKDYPELFAPKYIRLRVNVSTFPDKIELIKESYAIGNNLCVFENYDSDVLGACVSVFISNNDEAVTNQKVTLAVTDSNGETITNGISLWYYENNIKRDIYASTQIAHGKKVYIRYNSDLLGSVSNVKIVATSVVNDEYGEVALRLMGNLVPVLVNGGSTNTIVIKKGENFVLQDTEQTKGQPFVSIGDVSLDDCKITLEKNQTTISLTKRDENAYMIGAEEVGTTKIKITAPNGAVGEFYVSVYEDYDESNLAMRIGDTNYELGTETTEYNITMPIGKYFRTKLVRLTDPDNLDGDFTELKVLPTNLTVDVECAGDCVYVNASDKFLINAARNTGNENSVTYTIVSKSQSGEDKYLYIKFNIAVIAVLEGFSVDAKNFSIVSTDSFKNQAQVMVDKSLSTINMTAYPVATNIELQNLQFVLKCNLNNYPITYDDYSEENGCYLLEDAGKVKNFKIGVEVEQNHLTLTISCENISDDDQRVNVTLTVIYSQTYNNINGEEETKTDRNTVLQGVVRKAVVTQTLSFEKDTISRNINQLERDDKIITNKERATFSLGYTYGASGGNSISDIMYPGFKLFYKIGDTYEPFTLKEGSTTEYESRRGLSLILDEQNQRLTIVIDEYDDDYSEVDIFMVAKDCAESDDEVSAEDKDAVKAQVTLKLRNGTETDPFTISDAYDLKFVNNALSSYYIITNDIVLGDEMEWVPIGKDYSNAFNGYITTTGDKVFTISGLNIKQEASIEDATKTGEVVEGVNKYVAYYGLFGYIGKDAIISNIRLTDITIEILYSARNLGNDTDNYNHIDVYVGAFAGFNLGVLNNISVIDDTERGYSSLKWANIHNMSTSGRVKNYIAYRTSEDNEDTLLKKQSNTLFMGGMIGANGGKVNDDSKFSSVINVTMFVRDQPLSPTGEGVTAAYVGGVAGLNIGGTIKNMETYSLINATLADENYKGMIRNANSVVGGVVGFNESTTSSISQIDNVDADTIIVGLNNVGGLVGVNHGVLSNSKVRPHIYANNYVGGAVAINYNLGEVKTSDVSTTYGTNSLPLSVRFGFDTQNKYVTTSGTSNNTYSRGIIYYTKVQFQDTLDDFSFFNSAIIARDYVGGVVGYVLDTNVSDAKLNNLNNLSNSNAEDKLMTKDTVSSVAYSSANSYFVINSSNTTNNRTTVAQLTNVNELKYISQLYMSKDHKNAKEESDYITPNLDKNGLYYGDIIILGPVEDNDKLNYITSTDTNHYVGGVVGYVEGGTKTGISKGASVLNTAGGIFTHVYFNATITNTYNPSSTKKNDKGTIVGGLAGKTSGVIFVYNANILGTVLNSKMVGGFVGDATGLYDRILNEGCTLYTPAGGYIDTKTQSNYSGEYYINNSYTLLKSAQEDYASAEYVKNFAMFGENYGYSPNSGTGTTNTNVAGVTYDTSGTGYNSGDKYYVDKKISATLKYYENKALQTYNVESIERRRILESAGTVNIIIQANNTYEKINVNAESSYTTDKGDGYEQVTSTTGYAIYKKFPTTYYKKDETNNTYSEVTANYVPVYMPTGTAAPTYYKSSDINTNATLAGGGKKYVESGYYIATITAEYYTSDGGTDKITVATDVEPLYVERQAVYTQVIATKYEYNESGDCYICYNGFNYTTNGTITYTPADGGTTLSGDLYVQGTETISDLAKSSSIIKYSIRGGVYSSVTCDTSGNIVLDGTTIEYDSNNIYHQMINYIVNDSAAKPNNLVSTASAKYSYTLLTASNSFYAGFATSVYTKGTGDGTEIIFNDFSSDNISNYFANNIHYTNVTFSNLEFVGYDNNSTAGLYVQYTDSTTADYTIPTYNADNVLLSGGNKKPSDFIKSYNFSQYAYSLYEGSEKGLNTDKPNGEALYYYEDVHGGIPLAFGHAQDGNAKSLDLVIDLAPEKVTAEVTGDKSVEQVTKNDDGTLVGSHATEPIAVMLDWNKNGEENTYCLIGENSVVDAKIMPGFVGSSSIRVETSNADIVDIVKSGDNYYLEVKGVGYAIVTITSTLNNSIARDIVVLVREKISSLVYKYATINGYETINKEGTAKVLKNNSAIFSVVEKNGVIIDNEGAEFGIEYTITDADSIIVDNTTYNKGDDDTNIAFTLYGTDHTFKVSTEFSVEAKPFYLYTVNYGGNTLYFRKYFDEKNEISYKVDQTSYAYNVYAPNNLSSGIASQTNFDVMVKSNDDILVDVYLDFEYKVYENNAWIDKTASVRIGTTKAGAIYTSKFYVGTYDKKTEKWSYGTESAESITINDVTILNVGTSYNESNNTHTISFVGYIDPDKYINITRKLNFDITCSIKETADNVVRYDNFSYTILPFKVENVRINHYTKFFYNGNKPESNEYETTYKSYKYASTKIIPGYNSLLEVNISPYYASFDYVIAEIVGTDGSIIRQIVESKESRDNVSGVSAYYDYPYYDNVDNASNKIKAQNKFSSYNDSKAYDADNISNFSWDGSLLFALNLDSKYSDSSVTVRILGYSIEESGDTLQFDEYITLDVVELPQVALKWDNSATDCYSTTNESKTQASLNVGGKLPIVLDATNFDYVKTWTVEGNLGRVEQTSNGYVLTLDGFTTASLGRLNNEITVSCTVARVVDGIEYSATSSIKVLPVLYLIKGFEFVNAESGIMDTFYNQTYDIKLNVLAEYDENTLSRLGKLNDVKNALSGLNDQISKADSDKTSSYIYINEASSSTNLSAVDRSTTQGYKITVDKDGYFKIKIAQNSVKDTFIAWIGFDYEKEVGPRIKANHTELNVYGNTIQVQVRFNVQQTSDPEKPLPIKSVEDLKTMGTNGAGQNYILLNDLVLTDWVPIDGLFREFDGNGYTITIASFGNVVGLNNIGLFSTIGSDDDLGYVSTVKNLYIDICPLTISADGTIYTSSTGVLSVNIEATEDVSIGVLAGSNYGVITNVNVTNNASAIRNARKNSLEGIELIAVENLSKYFDSTVAFADSLGGKESVNVDADTHVDTFSVVTSNTKDTLGLNIGGLVGLNGSNGYITNSSVENVNVKGIDYVAGFVARNNGYISSSYFKAGSVISHDKQTKENSATAGFVALNDNGKIQFSYVLGAETVDMYSKSKKTSETYDNTTFIDDTTDKLVINSNSPLSNSTDKKLEQIQIDLTQYAGYMLYKIDEYQAANKYQFRNITALRALGSAVYTNNNASGFVGINNAVVSNCYSNILVAGTNGAGFAYDNTSGTIESSYSMSSIPNNDTNYSPFVSIATSVDKCFYLYVNANDGVDTIARVVTPEKKDDNGNVITPAVTEDVSVRDNFSNALRDVATSLYAAAFGDYNTFTSWGFNNDYSTNNNIEDGVWFIPSASTDTTNYITITRSSTKGFKDHLRQESYVSLRPELVSANLFTMSLKYYKNKVDEKDNIIDGEFEYEVVGDWKWSDKTTDISTGSVNNPQLVKTAEDFNTVCASGSEKTANGNAIRMVHDITFDEIQTAQTYNTDFIGNFEGNGLSINNLRFSATDFDSAVTYLGLFRSIRSETENGVTTHGSVRNLYINIEEINGSNINFVGVLAGAIDGGRVFNINVDGSDKQITVKGLNAVGGIAGIIIGDSEVVNVTSNVSVKANALNKLNLFDTHSPSTLNTSFKMFVPNKDTKELFEDSTTTADGILKAITNISYVGGIAGIIDVNENPKEGSNSKIEYTDRIRQCYVGESIKLTGEVVGGLAGYIGQKSNVSNSEFVVNDLTEISASRIGGGIVGHNEGTLNRVAVKYSNQSEIDAQFYDSDENKQSNSEFYNALDNATSNDSKYTLNVRSDVFTNNAHYIGGIIGSNIGGTLKNSYSRINVVNAYSAFAGGLIGQNVGGEIETVYTTGSVFGYYGTGGIIGIQPSIKYDEKEEKYYLDDDSTNNHGTATYARRYVENINEVLTNSKLKKNLDGYNNGTGATTYANVVGANIWRREDTNTNRTKYSSTQGLSNIGVFVGYMSNKELIAQNTINSRLLSENTFFKQTHVYSNTVNSIIAEVGNLGLIELTSIPSTVQVQNNGGKTTIISGVHTNILEYVYSRMCYFGSMRSLNEIVLRGYNANDADKLWVMINVTDKRESDIVKADSVTTKMYRNWNTYNWNGTQVDSSGAIINEVETVRDVFPSIVNNLKPKIVNVTSETDLLKMHDYPDATFILQNDITLTAAWAPVDKFTGKLYSAIKNGKQQQYTISNLQIDDSANDYFGFVRVANGAEFRDFNIKVSDIRNNTAQADDKNINASSVGSDTTLAGGILAGKAYNGAKISDITISFMQATSAVYIYNTRYVGGIVGILGGDSDTATTTDNAGTLTGVTLKGFGDTNKNKFYSSQFRFAGSVIHYYFGGIVGFTNVTKKEDNEVKKLNISNMTLLPNYKLSGGEDVNIANDEGFTAYNNSSRVWDSNLVTGGDSSTVGIGGVIGCVNSAYDDICFTSQNVDMKVYIPRKGDAATSQVAGGVAFSQDVKYGVCTVTGGSISETIQIAPGGSDSGNKTQTYAGGVFGLLHGTEVEQIIAACNITVNVENNLIGQRHDAFVSVGGAVGGMWNSNIGCEIDKEGNITNTGKQSVSTGKITINTTNCDDSENHFYNIYAGGFVGEFESCSLYNTQVECYEKNNTLTKKTDIITLNDTVGSTNSSNNNINLGGIIGFGEGIVKIENCHAIGNIKHEGANNEELKGAYSAYIGGAIGKVEETTYVENSKGLIDQISTDVDIIDSRYTKDTGTFAYGGLVGDSNNLGITNSYAVGKIYSLQQLTYVNSSDTTNLGGLVGSADTLTIKNSYSATQFVLDNGHASSQTFWESKNKGGIVGKVNSYSDENVYYVKDFVPFGNSYGKGVDAEELKEHFDSAFTKDDNNFYPYIEGAVTNVKGGNQNPIMYTEGILDYEDETTKTTTTIINNNKTVYVLDSSSTLNYDIDVEFGSTLVICGSAGCDNKRITNNGMILGGSITNPNVNIKNDGSIIGLRGSVTMSAGSTGFAYASEFASSDSVQLKSVVNCYIRGTITLGSVFNNNVVWCDNNYIYYKNKSTNKTLTSDQASFVDQITIDLDIDKYWARITGENGGRLVPAWMYKEDYYDAEYEYSYDWKFVGKECADLTPVENTYTITTPQQLAWVAYQVNNGTSFEGETIKLGADIDLSGKLWTPIGLTTAFEGTFDGDGYTISNMSVVGNTCNGLFGKVNGATIKNVLISNAQVASNKTNTAILVGSATSATIEKVGIEDAHIYGKCGFVGSGSAEITNSYIVVAANGGLTYATSSESNSLSQVYGAVIEYDSDKKHKLSEGENSNYTFAESSLTSCYRLSSVSGDNGKTINEMRNEWLDGFNWATVWTRVRGKNYSLPRLTFAEEYWIDEGEKCADLTSVDNTYTITTPQELAWVAYQVNNSENGESFSGKTIKLGADIDLGGKLWTPIGVEFNSENFRYFKGNFDGGGFTISNMTCLGAYSVLSERNKLINNTPSDYSNGGYSAEYGGLFGLVQNATIQNVTLTNFLVNSVNDGGALVAKYELSTTSKSINKITIGADADNTYLDKITASKHAGGMIGCLTGTNNLSVSECNVYHTTITASGSTVYAGGLIGQCSNTGSTKVATISNCSVSSNTKITASGSVNAYAGGIAGMIVDGGIIGCTVGGSVKGKTAGGIVGYAVNNVTIVSCVSSATVEGTTAGGLVGAFNGSALNQAYIFNSTVELAEISNNANGGDIGGVVGNAQNVVISAVKMDSVQVNNRTTDLKTVQSVGGIVGIAENCIIQNIDMNTIKMDTTYSSSTVYFGGMVGYLNGGYLSEVSLVNDSSYTLGALPSSFAHRGVICGSIKGTTEGNDGTIQNIFINTNTTDDLTGTIGSFMTGKLVGSDFSVNNKGISIVNVSKVNTDDLKESSAWKYNNSGVYRELVTDGSSLVSNYRVNNADILINDINNNSIPTITIDGTEYILYTPYSFDTFNVPDFTALQYVSDYWRYRHVTSDMSIQITDNITMGDTFTPIGNEGYPFSGSIDSSEGKKTITFGSLMTYSQVYVGVFGYATELSACNLTIAKGSNNQNQGFSTSGNYNYVGAVVGYLNTTDDCEFSNITSDIDIYGKSYVGGLIGYANVAGEGSLELTDCVVMTQVSDGYKMSGIATTIKASANYAGGMIGKAEAEVAGKITISGTTTGGVTNSYTQVLVEGKTYVGGVVGDGKCVTISKVDVKGLKDKDGKWTDYTVTTNYSTASDFEAYIGGVAGKADSSIVTTCKVYNAKIAGTDYSKYVGGIVGKMSNTLPSYKAVITVCSTVGSGSVYGKEYVGGIVGKFNSSNKENSISTCTNKFNVTADEYVGGIIGKGDSANTLTYENNRVGDDTSTGYNQTTAIKIIGTKYVGGFAGFLTYPISNGNTYEINFISANKVYNAYIKGDDNVGGFIGWAKTYNRYQSGYTCECGNKTSPVKGATIGTVAYGKTCTCGKDCTIARYVETEKIIMNKQNNILYSHIVFTGITPDTNEGWFSSPAAYSDYGNDGNLESSVRWTNDTFSSEAMKNALFGKYLTYSTSSSSEYGFLYEGQGQGYSRKFDNENIDKYNTWFGPTDGVDSKLSEAEATFANGCYLSTLGNCSVARGKYSNSEETGYYPDLTTLANIKSFFSTARGYGGISNKTYNVGTLYGYGGITDNTSICTDVYITTDNTNISTRGGTKENDRLLDSFTHWILMVTYQNGTYYYGYMVIEWTYWLDSTQKSPNTYDFINDIQQDFWTEENNRIDVKYYYVIDKNLNNLYGSNVRSHLNVLSYSMRNIHDYLDYGGTTYGNTSDKGLINEFVQNVRNMTTTTKYTSETFKQGEGTIKLNEKSKWYYDEKEKRLWYLEDDSTKYLRESRDVYSLYYLGNHIEDSEISRLKVAIKSP